MVNRGSINKMKPLVSIVTVTLNSERYLEDAINSVVNQTYPHIEYIVIDGGSTDGTVDIIKRYADYIDAWVSEADKGLYDAMNKGISMAHGELVGILNSDDWYEPDAVEEVVKEYNKESDCCLLHGDIRFTTEDGQNIGTLKPEFNRKKMWFQMPVNHPTCFVKKAAYDKFGTFNIKYKIAADYDFVLRLFTKGIKARYIDKVLVNMRTGGISVVGEKEAWVEMKEINIENGLNPVRAYGYLYYKKIKRKIREVLDESRLHFLVNLKRSVIKDDRFLKDDRE